MNRNIRFLSIRGALRLAVACSLLASSLAGVARANSFGSIQWAGMGTTSEALKGKSVVMVSFVTWCPICNTWSPDMLSQLKKATEDKPVIVLAVATDVGPAEAKDYMLKHNFSGSNILYGADANVAKEFGVEAKNLWNYVWFDSTGKLKTKGAAGTYFAGAKDTKDFVLPKQINQEKDLGTLDFVASGQSAKVKEFAWAVELGNLTLLTQISSPTLQRSFAKEDRQSLVEMQTKFLDTRLASVKELSTGDVPQKIEAYETATMLGSHFRTTTQGKEAIKIASTLNGDPKFRKEMTAEKQYNSAQSKAAGDDAKLAKLLRAVSVHFADTYYGEQAKREAEAAAGETATKDSTAKDAKSAKSSNESAAKGSTSKPTTPKSDSASSASSS